ncbi:MAG: ribosome-binding factor A [Acidimicrobiales bacterium]
MSERRHTFPSRGGARFARSLRINQVMRQVLAEELERLADADERLGLLTITSVETTPDLRQATVYLSSLAEEAAVALDERRKQLQGCVGRQMRIKRTPRLSFVADPAVSTGAAVEETLRRLKLPPEEPQDR